jgi:hypothetical protein
MMTEENLDKRNELHWVRIRWEDTTQDMKIWIKGTTDNKFRAYGPHKVHNIDRRQLRSGTPGAKGVVFRHYPEELLIPANHYRVI